MRSLSTPRRTRMMAAVLAAVSLPIASVGFAYAAHDAGGAAGYTGCLTPGGTLTSIGVGDQPAKPCAPGAVVAHFGEGDQLPQSCAAGQVATWDGAGWVCGNDDAGAAYSAGEGLTLNGTELSLLGGYQLPQDCELGQVPVLVPGLSSQLRDWGCAAPSTGGGGGGGSVAYLAVERNPIDGTESIGILSNFQPHEMVRLDLPPGTYTLQASGTVEQGPPDGFRDAADGCVLTAAGTTLHRATLVAAPQVTTISLNSAARLPSGGTVRVTCNTSLDGTYGRNFRLVATSVGSLVD